MNCPKEYPKNARNTIADVLRFECSAYTDVSGISICALSGNQCTCVEDVVDTCVAGTWKVLTDLARVYRVAETDRVNKLLLLVKADIECSNDEQKNSK